MKAALRSYRAETLHWAERRSAGQPSLAELARRSERWAALPRWSLGAIAIITIATGVAHLSGARDSVDGSIPVPLTVQQARPLDAEIAADNKLMNSIEAELSYHAHSPVDAADLRASATHEPHQVTSVNGPEE